MFCACHMHVVTETALILWCLLICSGSAAKWHTDTFTMILCSVLSWQEWQLPFYSEPSGAF